MTKEIKYMKENFKQNFSFILKEKYFLIAKL